MKVIAILNPTSGRGSGLKLASKVQALADSLGLSFEIRLTEVPGHAIELAKQAVSDGATVVAACGGDGTIFQVLNGIMGSDVTLAPIPLGTGNDLCRSLGFGTQWEKAVTAIASGKRQRIDVGRVTTGSSSAYFHNIAGTGFDVAVAVRINTGLRKLKGTAAYIAGVLGTLASYKAIPMKITIDGDVTEARIMLCAVANAKSYGGAMKIAPNALLDDGFFDVVLVKDVSTFEFLRTFPSVFKGTHLSHPKIDVVRAKCVRIETDPSVSILVDGELLDGTPADFEIIPGAIEVVIPSTGIP